MQRLIIVGWCFFAMVSGLHAADIVRDISTGRINEDENGGYFELGVSGGFYNPALQNDLLNEETGVVMNIVAGGAYRYNRWFIEASQGTFDGLNLGYALHADRYYSVDLLLASIFGNIDTENVSRDNIALLPENQRNEALLNRDTLYSGAGIRATLYLNDTIVQFRLVDDVFDDAGLTSTLRLGLSKLYRNWNVHAIVSAEYDSSNTVNYFYGIEPDEATNRFPAYDAGSGISYSGEVGVTYPLSKDWVFRSFLRLRRLPTEASDSPLVEGNTDTLFFNSISYVF